MRITSSLASSCSAPVHSGSTKSRWNSSPRPETDFDKLSIGKLKVTMNFTSVAAAAMLVLVSVTPAFCQGIQQAVRDGDLQAVGILLKSAPDVVFDKDSHGQTPLHVAAYTGQTEMAELLLANKADANAADNYGSTPLHLAARAGRRDLAELLITNKADVNARDKDGWTPLHFTAVGDDKLEAVDKMAIEKLLLDHNADVNIKANGGYTPLHFAASWGARDKAELLLAHNADVSARDNKGETPLHVVGWRDREGVAELLRRHGAR